MARGRGARGDSGGTGGAGTVTSEAGRRRPPLPPSSPGSPPDPPLAVTVPASRPPGSSAGRAGQERARPGGPERSVGLGVAPEIPSGAAEPIGPDRSGAAASPGRLPSLADTLVALSEEPGLPEAPRLVAETARRLTDAGYGAVDLLDADGQVVDVVGAGADNDVAQALATPREAAGPAPAYSTPATFFAAPVAVRGIVLGVLRLVGKRGGGPFTREDEAVATALATALAVVLDNARLREEARRGASWHAASGEIAAALVSVAEPWSALDLVARHARRVTGACLAAIVLPDPRRGLVVTNADGPGADGLRGLELPVERSPLLETMRAGRARRVGAGELAALLGPPVEPAGRGRAMVVPMVAAGRSVGVLVLGPPTPGVSAGSGVPARSAEPVGQAGDGPAGRCDADAPFVELDLRMATAFAGQAALTLELGRLQRDRERLAVFEDRDRIARDLHDVVIQRLFATGLGLQILARSVPDRAAARLTEAAGELDQTITELRHTIFSLTSPTPDGAQLRAEIGRIVAQAEHSLGLRPVVRLDGPVERVPMVIHPHLLAALREALSNIARHSRARRVGVLVLVGDDDVLVEVHDDGVGPGGASVTSGLANLRRRAQDLGGHLEFGAGAGGVGTRVRWRVPLVGRPTPASGAAGPAPPGLPRP
ncbi:GAF domain-containing sensor histidine kinase [Frankia sp. CN7]|uniref:GAF domain-containing sensor histidine kinase n=1 Tax=Frankia nepalensis TaxID=1836974 RepID=A0A937RFA3_9ACTN|nr:GAF domain-containing sensor histidine kinase [Frankia nepalensis]MBL7513401.1 GAF domain-containing sensor histidine kinase [Frankia nepalensis]MBL7626349.1 GAF domain-containing sensor histidine kinase [Frankia nepalensis]